MAKTTIDKVKMIASHLEGLSDEQIELYMDDAWIELEDINYDDKYEEKLHRYLTAHYGSIDQRRATKKKMEDMSVSYEGASSLAEGKDFLETTEYGQEVIRILEKEKGANFLLLS